MHARSNFGWVKRLGAALPPPRQSAAMAYDAGRQEIILVGGIGVTDAIADGVAVAAVLGDTWTWDGLVWTPRLPGVSPPARAGVSIAYDAARQTLVLFGGTDQHGLTLNDTWTWDGTAWTQQRPSISPPARTGANMTYDVATHRVLLFGGVACVDRTSVFLDDTWAWDGATWVQLRPAVAPSPRVGASMTSDASNQTVVLFGGGSGRQWDDTWTWDGTTWTLHQPPTSPPARAYARMAYDEGNRVAVLFGGVDRSNLTDTWAWDGVAATWPQLQPAAAPAQGQHANMVYDATRGHIVLFTTIVTKAYNPAELRPRPPIWVAEMWTS